MGVVIGLAFLAALAALAASKGSSSPAAGRLPDGSGPTEFPQLSGKQPVANTAKAASGRMYEIWLWPSVPGMGVYTVARLAGSTAWVSFVYNADTNKSQPIKTNVMTLPISDGEKAQLLGYMRTDWNLPQ